MIRGYGAGDPAIVGHLTRLEEAVARHKAGTTARHRVRGMKKSPLVALVLPTFPLGPGDITPTPEGKVVIDFLNGGLASDLFEGWLLRRQPRVPLEAAACPPRK